MRRPVHDIALLTALALSLALAPQAPAQPRKRVLLVIVNPDSKVTDLSMNQLRRSYLGESIVEGGTQLIPINLPPSSRARIGFDQRVLDMSPEQVARFWNDRKIRGGELPPKELPSEKKVLMIAARYPTVVAYLPDELLQTAFADRVKIITVDGKLYTDPSYPLTY